MSETIGSKYPKFESFGKNFKDEIPVHIGRLGGRRYTVDKVEFSIKELIHHVLFLANQAQSKPTKQELQKVVDDLRALDAKGEAKLVDRKITGTLARILTEIKSLFGNIYHGKNSGLKQLDDLIEKLPNPLEEPKKEESNEQEVKKEEPPKEEFKNEDPPKEEVKKEELKIEEVLPEVSKREPVPVIVYPGKEELIKTYTEGVVNRALKRYNIDSEVSISLEMVECLKVSIVAHLNYDEIQAILGNSKKSVSLHLHNTRNNLFKSGKPNIVNEQLDRDWKLLESLVKIDQMASGPSQKKSDFTKSFDFAELISREIGYLPLSEIGEEGVLVHLKNNQGGVDCKTMFELISEKGATAAVLVPFDSKDKTVQIVFKGLDNIQDLQPSHFEGVEAKILQNLEKIIGSDKSFDFELFGLGMGGLRAQEMSVSLAKSPSFKFSKMSVYAFNPLGIDLTADQEFSKICAEKGIEFHAHYFKNAKDSSALLSFPGKTYLGFNDVFWSAVTTTPSKTSASVFTFELPQESSPTESNIEVAKRLVKAHYEYLISSEAKLAVSTTDKTHRQEPLKVANTFAAGLKAVSLVTALGNKEYNELKKIPELSTKLLEVLELGDPERAERLKLAMVMTNLTDYYAILNSPDVLSKGLKDIFWGYFGDLFSTRTKPEDGKQ